MFPSSALCWARQAHESDRALSAPLANVRAVAAKAALVWELEAHAAERREHRHDRTKAIAAHLTELKRERREALDRGLSENPDRGFESP